MNTFSVVEALDELKDFEDGLFPCMDVSQVQFPFEDGEEGFRRGIVITISPAGHACLYSMFCKLFLILHAPVLASLVRMTDQSLGNISFLQGLP